MDYCRIDYWHPYPIPTCSILSYVISDCSMYFYSSQYMSTVVYMCLEWSWENGVLFRDSAGIKRVLRRTLFGCCSDVPGECSGALRRNAKKVRTKSGLIPAQDRIDIGFFVLIGNALKLNSTIKDNLMEYNKPRV